LLHQKIIVLLSASAPISSNSVGSRLASFQEESPVHNFKWRKDQTIKSPDSPSRFDAFFGAKEDFSVESAQAERLAVNKGASQLSDLVILPTEKDKSPTDSFLADSLQNNRDWSSSISSSLGGSSIDTKPIINPSFLQEPHGDKYGAFANLFVDSTKLNDSFSPSDAGKCDFATIPQDLFSFSSPDAKVVKGHSESNDFSEKEEDFGDFIAVSQEDLTVKQPFAVSDPFSLQENLPTQKDENFSALSFNSSHVSQGQISSMPSIFPSSGNTRVIPWYESSPPPLPQGVLFFLHKLQEIFSI